MDFSPSNKIMTRDHEDAIAVEAIPATSGDFLTALGVENSRLSGRWITLRLKIIKYRE